EYMSRSAISRRKCQRWPIFLFTLMVLPTGRRDARPGRLITHLATVVVILSVPTAAVADATGPLYLAAKTRRRSRPSAGARPASPRGWTRSCQGLRSNEEGWVDPVTSMTGSDVQLSTGI